MLNNVCIMGRLTTNPELRQTASGTPVTSFAIAVQRNYAPSGQERQADFIDCVAWQKTAEFVTRYCTKGQLIVIEGSLQTRSYTDRAGNNRKAIEVIADTVHFTERRANAEQPQYADVLCDAFEEVTGEDLPFA